MRRVLAFPSGNVYDMTIQKLEEIEMELAVLINRMKAEKGDQDEAVSGEE